MAKAYRTVSDKFGGYHHHKQQHACQTSNQALFPVTLFLTIIKRYQKCNQQGDFAHRPAKGRPEGKRQCDKIFDNCQAAEDGAQKDKGQRLHS